MRNLMKAGLAAALLAATSGSALAQSGPTPLPRIETRNGHHALMVDGAPFLMLGAQVNNASNYPAMLPEVWPTIEQLHANTVEIPVAWEQIEPREGQFDFSYLDTLLKEARQRHMRLVLLWFGTWKNTAPSYAPAWVKLDPKRFPHMVDAHGNMHYALTPHSRTTLEADKRAFVRLMDYLKANDPDNTVIMIQPENEVGSYGSVRDFAPAAQKLFDGQVPAALLKQVHKKPGTWRQVFGSDADEFFHAWSIAAYVNEIATAGKAVKNLPMYMNCALPSAFGRQNAATYASGGPNQFVIDVYKAAAPAIDVVAPDIYVRDHAAYMTYLGAYARPDNALFVPETGNDRDYARYFFAVTGKGASASPPSAWIRPASSTIRWAPRNSTRRPSKPSPATTVSSPPCSANGRNGLLLVTPGARTSPPTRRRSTRRCFTLGNMTSPPPTASYSSAGMRLPAIPSPRAASRWRSPATTSSSSRAMTPASPSPWLIPLSGKT